VFIISKGVFFIMTITARNASLHLLLILVVTSLVSCGGGGGGNSGAGGTSSSAITQDTTPDAISFAPTNNAEPSAAVTSQAITISGINTAAPISISGGEYAIAGGAFTATPGTVTNSQSLVIRITASDKTNTSNEATLTVGGVSAKFTVTTLADTTPDAFSFPAKTEAAFNTEYTSDAITVKGIDVAVPISITGGTYSINGGTFTSAAGTVSVDQTITVKTTSASKTESTQNVVLTVGGVEGTFAVTTINDTFPPVAEFKFPTPYTMSEASEVKVRGTATDDNAITSVKLLVSNSVNNTVAEIDATPKSETDGVKDFSSWTATIPLTANAENEIKVVAIDALTNENTLDTAKQVKIRQAELKSAFPDEDNAHGSMENAGVVYDAARGRLLSADRNSIIATDIRTGKRIIFATFYNTISGLVIDPKNQNLYVRANINSIYKLARFSLENSSDLEIYDNSKYFIQESISSRAIILDDSDENDIKIIESQSFMNWAGTLLSFSVKTKQLSSLHTVNEEVLTDADGMLFATHGAVYDKANNRYLFATGGQMAIEYRAIVAVNPVTVEQTIFSSNAVGEGEKFSGSLGERGASWLAGMAINERTHILYVLEAVTGKLIEIDLKTGNRRLNADLNYATGSSMARYGNAFYLDAVDDVIYALESGRVVLRVIDTETGEKVILSKSKNNF
jgi:hypothetical protein